jgi:hypothetical protein
MVDKAPGRALPHTDRELEKLMGRLGDPRTAEICSHGKAEACWAASARRWADSELERERGEKLLWAQHLLAVYSRRAKEYAGVVRQLEDGAA